LHGVDAQVSGYPPPLGPDHADDSFAAGMHVVQDARLTPVGVLMRDPCRFAYVKLASPIFWKVFPEIHGGGNAAGNAHEIR
jgi:hypothetical protein